MQDWMTMLGAHYRFLRQRYPQDKLLVVFDIDGTILDMRHLVQHVLRWYDAVHDTQWFAALTLDEIDTHEHAVDRVLDKRPLPGLVREAVLAWYHEHYWDDEALRVSLKPFAGVMQVIRWFQSQPNTMVGLNTARFAAQRWETLRSLNALGAPHGVYFSNRLLYMRANGWQRSAPESKVAGLRMYQAMGYRIVAMVDNEPDNLAAIARTDARREILLLHADTLYLSSNRLLPPQALQGTDYNPQALATIAAHVPVARGPVHRLPNSTRKS